MSFIYLASPYTSPDKEVMEKRYKEVLEIAHRMTAQGITVYSPIVHYHPMAAHYELPRDAEFWKKHNTVMLDNAGGLAVLKLDGWEQSKGIHYERNRAYYRCKPVYYVHPSDAIFKHLL